MQVFCISIKAPESAPKAGEIRRFSLGYWHQGSKIPLGRESVLDILHSGNVYRQTARILENNRNPKEKYPTVYRKLQADFRLSEKDGLAGGKFFVKMTRSGRSLQGILVKVPKSRKGALFLQIRR